MKQTTIEWIEKAEGDFAIVEREIAVEDNPNYDGICFHCQQCAEKYLKAALCESGRSFGKIHDLVVLLSQTLDIEPTLESFREDLAYLSDFAIAFRYPGESADKETALEARERCRRFREAARASLGFEK